jgi:hypothetical protein
MLIFLTVEETVPKVPSFPKTKVEDDSIDVNSKTLQPRSSSSTLSTKSKHLSSSRARPIVFDFFGVLNESSGSCCFPWSHLEPPLSVVGSVDRPNEDDGFRNPILFPQFVYACVSLAKRKQKTKKPTTDHLSAVSREGLVSLVGQLLGLLLNLRIFSDS